MNIPGLMIFLLLASGSTDPFVGLWKLDIMKSHYPDGQSPKWMTIEMKPAGNGIAYRSETEFANGRRMTSEYTAEYDGPEVLVTGGRGVQTPVALKRIDANTVEAAYLRAMKPVATSRRAVSSDGRTMTITTVSKDGNGKVVTNVGIYDRLR